jgi:hypothetical protein
MKVSKLHFYKGEGGDTDIFYFAYFAGYRITVLDRLTGFGDGNIRDIETGLKDYTKDSNNDFWLASGNFDIRKYPDLTVYEAIDKIKENANTICPQALSTNQEPKELTEEIDIITNERFVTIGESVYVKKAGSDCDNCDLNHCCENVSLRCVNGHWRLR